MKVTFYCLHNSRPETARESEEEIPFSKKSNVNSHEFTRKIVAPRRLSLLTHGGAMSTI
jgi:hypothetical protein